MSDHNSSRRVRVRLRHSLAEDTELECVLPNTMEEIEAAFPELKLPTTGEESEE